MSDNNNSANDYALAKQINERVINIFTLVVDHASTPDITAVNRSYVLLVNELKQIYARQPELQKAGMPICWKVIDNLEQIHETAIEYTLFASDYGQEHNSNVSTLCIKANIEKPDLSPHIEKLLREAAENISTFKSEIDKMYATLSIETVSARPVVTIGEEKYYLSSMRDGLAYTIISYCLKKHPNAQIDLKTLKSELKDADLSPNGLNNLRENIRNSQFGGKSPLSPFVAAFPKAIIVRQTTDLSDEQIDAIKAAIKLA